MKVRLTYVLACCILTAAALAAPARPPKPASGAGACERPPCRPEKLVGLNVPGAPELTFSVGVSPYVTREGEILIVPGEILVMRAELVDGEPARLSFAADKSPPPVREIDMPAGGGQPARKVKMYSGVYPLADINLLPLLAGQPKGTIVFAYGHTNEGTFLVAAHNFGSMVKYGAVAGFWHPDGIDFQATSICPIRVGLNGAEHWPNAIGPMFLKEFRAVEEGSKDAGCD